MESKVCSKCNIEKEINLFHKRKGASDGYRGVCNTCMRNKPKERKLKFCNNCNLELGRETLNKLCKDCKEIGKIFSVQKANTKSSLKREQTYTEKIKKELEFIYRNDNEKEIWKDIPDFKSKYQASNIGRIRCLPHVYRNNNGTLITQSFYYVSMKNTRGYLQTPLTDFNGKTHHKGTHRWVMYAFYGKSELQVDHINGIKDDNRLENLRYATPRENNNYKKDINPNYFSSSLYGAYKHKSSWHSYIKIEGVEYYLGSYTTDVDANRIYMKSWREWEEQNKLPEKFINLNKTSQIDSIDFHGISGKWRVRVKETRLYIGIFKTEHLAKKVLDIINYLIKKSIKVDKELVLKIRKKYGKDDRFKKMVEHTETGEIYKSISATAKIHHISPTRLKKHLEGELITDLKFKYKNANTTT